MAWTDWYTEEELAKARAFDEFGMGTDMSPSGSLFDEIQSSQQVGDEASRQEAQNIFTGLSMIPVLGPTMRGGQYAVSKLAPFLKKPFTSTVPKISKTTGQPVPVYQSKSIKMPSGATKQMNKPVKDAKGNIVYRTEQVVDPKKVAAVTIPGAAGVGYALNQGDSATSTTSVKPTKPPAPTEPSLMNNGDANKPDTPKNLPSLWENIQSRDWWSTPIKGGSGDWDNRLFRLGEMMEYMDTPLDRRGKNPASRWTASQTEANKIKAAIAKESGKGKGAKVPTGTYKEAVMSELKNDKVLWDTFFSKYDADELDKLGSTAELKMADLVDTGMSYEQALKQTLLELRLGL